jgi:hypothetical protein
MAGSDKFGVDSICIVEKTTKLDPLIATYARIWGSTVQIVINEVVHDSAKIFLQVESIEGNIHPRSDSSGVGSVRSRATALFVVCSRLGQTTKHRQAWLSFVDPAGLTGFLTMPHENPDHIVTSLQKQVCCDA